MGGFGFDPAPLDGESGVLLEFLDAELRTVSLRFESIFEELARLGVLPPEARQFSVTERIALDYGEVEISVPDESSIRRLPPPTEPLPPRYVVGTCFARNDFEVVERPVTVPCTQPRYGEVFHVGQIDAPFDAPFPGEEEINRIGTEICNETFEPLTGAHIEITVLEARLWYPSAESWAAFDREVACFVRFPEATEVPLGQLDPLRQEPYVSAFGLETGDCLDGSSVFDLFFLLTDCSEPHLFEVYHSEVFPDGGFPGEAEATRRVDDICLTQFEAVAGEPFATSQWSIERLYPSGLSWDRYGDRLISCIATTFEPVTESVVAG